MIEMEQPTQETLERLTACAGRLGLSLDFKDIAAPGETIDRYLLAIGDLLAAALDRFERIDG